MSPFLIPYRMSRLRFVMSESSRLCWRVSAAARTTTTTTTQQHNKKCFAIIFRTMSNLCTKNGPNTTVAAMCWRTIGVVTTHSLVDGLTSSVKITRKACSRRNDAITWRESVFNGQSGNKPNGRKCSKGFKPTNKNTTVAAMCHNNIVQTQSLADGFQSNVIFSRKACLQRNDSIN